MCRNLPVWFINHAIAAHGFDLDDASLMSQRVIEQVLSFLRTHPHADEGTVPDGPPTLRAGQRPMPF